MNSDVTIEVPTKAVTIPVGAAVRVSAVVSPGVVNPISPVRHYAM
jgi:hypothetical protein